MKLTTVFMIIACLQVSAAGFSQKVTIKGENISIQRIFEDIRKQTGFQFLYADDALRTAKPISLSVRNEKLENVLALCFRDQLLSYTISDKTIVVKRKYAEPTVVAAIEPEAVAPPDIKGKVTDNNGAPLADVSVAVKGTTRGTLTDASGNFSISVNEGDVLVFSYVGFTTIEQKIGKNTTISISLKAVEKAIDEIVVVGYGTQKKRDLTGSVSSIKGEEVANRPATNPIASLQGG
jgi:TonB-dependent starch-binding outer membrane protein SusC